MSSGGRPPPFGSVPRAKLQEGFLLHQKGKLAEAERLYEDVLRAEPNNFGALHLLGIVALQTARFERGAQLLARAVRVNPTVAAVHGDLGLALNAIGRHADAVASFDRAIALEPAKADVHINRGNALSGMKRHENAIASYDRALAIEPDHAVAYVNRSIAFNALGRRTEALASAERAIALDPSQVDARVNLGIARNALGRHEEAVADFERAIALRPGHAEAHVNLGNALAALKRRDEALSSYDAALALRPNDPDAHNNRGVALDAMGRSEEALTSYDRAIALRQNFADAYINRAAALSGLGRHEDAIASAMKGTAIAPDRSQAHNQWGVALRGLKRHEEALSHFERAVLLAPDEANAHFNRALALTALQRLEEALAAYDRAIVVDPSSAAAHNNRAVVLNLLKHHEEALASYEAAVAIQADFDFCKGEVVQTKMRICDWRRLDDLVDELAAGVDRGEKIVAPFAALSVIDSPGYQRRAAEIYVASVLPRNAWVGRLEPYQAHPRIRVGYFSADFHNHATAVLMAELFERHDRTRFEVTAFSFGGPSQGPMRERLVAAFDNFVEVQNHTDAQMAAMAREYEIDIGVDLKGHTEGARPGVFAYRAAPVQVNFLGYPGTVGLSAIDYLIADHRLIPDTHRKHYSEKIVLLPDSYQPNDSRGRIAEREFTRAELGLPASGFVFCCFNNNFKITPQRFDSWMRILGSVEGSVLWLLEDNSAVSGNLRREAAARGVDPARLVFASRMDFPEHLARHRLTDLFLDTGPYGAHTTASDALWAGLPVLTLAGNSFASRVGASLLTAVNLPELITATAQEYEERAIDLAKDVALLETIRKKLSFNGGAGALFNCARYTRHLEAAYIAMTERCRAGLPPDHIEVPAEA